MNKEKEKEEHEELDCCKESYDFKLRTLKCDGKGCSIWKDRNYFSYNNGTAGSKNFRYCLKCFREIAGDNLTLKIDKLQWIIPKEKFKKIKNSQTTPEAIVRCQRCGRPHHQICALWLDPIWPEGFTCNSCLQETKQTRSKNPFRAKYLQRTVLSDFIDANVQNFMLRNELRAGKVHVRVLATCDKICELLPHMKQNCPEMPNEFPYRSKSIFAFQETDDCDVCFFGMIVQEYGAECPAPNRKRVHIAMLDSVHFFEPSPFRTVVYYQILLGYFEYIKKAGFVTAHLWSMPPPPGSDYLFHEHPNNQLTPSNCRLQHWYATLMSLGEKKKVFKASMLWKKIEAGAFTSVTELPYFYGDFWPTELEALIRRCKVGNKTVETHNNAKRMCEKFSKTLFKHYCATARKMKDAFFLVELQDEELAIDWHIEDPDPLIDCKLMENESFLNFAYVHNLEFSSGRRACFSTMYLLYELHKCSGSAVCQELLERFKKHLKNSDPNKVSSCEQCCLLGRLGCRHAVHCLEENCPVAKAMCHNKAKEDYVGRGLSTRVYVKPTSSVRIRICERPTSSVKNDEEARVK